MQNLATFGEWTMKSLAAFIAAFSACAAPPRGGGEPLVRATVVREWIPGHQDVKFHDERDQLVELGEWNLLIEIPSEQVIVVLRFTADRDVHFADIADDATARAFCHEDGDCPTWLEGETPPLRSGRIVAYHATEGISSSDKFEIHLPRSQVERLVRMAELRLETARKIARESEVLGRQLAGWIAETPDFAATFWEEESTD